MTGQFAGFDLQQLLILVPEAGSGNMTPEAITARLADIRSMYSPEQITVFLLAGTPPPAQMANALEPGTQEPTRTPRTRGKAKNGGE